MTDVMLPGILTMNVARTHAFVEIAISQRDASSGPGKHEAIGQMLPGSDDALCLEMGDFPSAMGSCYYPIACKKH